MFFDSRERERLAGEISNLPVSHPQKRALFGALVSAEITDNHERVRVERVRAMEQEDRLRQSAHRLLIRGRAKEVGVYPVPSHDISKPFQWEDIIRKEDMSLFEFPVAPTNKGKDMG